MFPKTIESEEQLETLLSEPTFAVVEAIQKCPGDVLVLGAAGKMGPSLAHMICRAGEMAGTSHRVIGVSRFSSPGSEDILNEFGVETIRGDLLDEGFLRTLPDVPNIIYMPAMKFGSTENASLTWAMNVYLPTLICKRFLDSRIVAFSTGNVYPFVPIDSGGCKETDPTGPVGEYAITGLGRERMFEHFSQTLNIPVSIIRLNYATEMRYGVLVDIAQRVWNGEPIDVTMGYANVIWQGDANAMAIAALADCSSPPFVVNVAGQELIRVREVAQQFASLMKKEATITGEEAPTALLNNGSEGHAKYGSPSVTVQEMVPAIADWVMNDRTLLGKPTKFEKRDGKF